MNMINELDIKTVVLSQVIDRSNRAMNKKHYNRLSSKIMPTQINMFNMQNMI
jgi:hypothetical protein